MTADHSTRLAIIGAGPSGIGMGALLKRHGSADFVVFEASSHVGGVWNENGYPGMSCDTPAHLYAFSFAKPYPWPSLFASAEDIRNYLTSVVDEFGLQSHLQLNTGVERAVWNGRAWDLTLSNGEVWQADHVISATGYLNQPAFPKISGVGAFSGVEMHSARWDSEASIDGAKVAVIGAAASAAQVVTAIAPKVKSLTVFQRSPSWMLPLGQVDIPKPLRTIVTHIPGMNRLFRAVVFGFLEWARVGLRLGARRNRWFEKRARTHLNNVVEDDELRTALTPEYPFGCKPVVLDNGYLKTLQQSHVTLVPHGVTKLTKKTVVDGLGKAHTVDVVIYATGFEPFSHGRSMTVVGPDGKQLSDVWAKVVRGHRGVMVPGFPNFFTLLGPNTSAVPGSSVKTIEAQSQWVLEAIDMLAQRGCHRISPTQAAADEWNRRVQERFGYTVFLSCQSWYRDDNGENIAIWPFSHARLQWELRHVNPAEFDIA